MSIKVLLADDSDVMRRAIVKLLNEEPSTELVGEAKGFAETIQLANELKPDVLVMDLHMNFIFTSLIDIAQHTDRLERSSCSCCGFT